MKINIKDEQEYLDFITNSDTYRPHTYNPPDLINPKDLIGITKPPLSLVPPVGTIHTAMAMKDGAAKYGPYNWRENPVVSSIYIDAALRHIASWQDGEELAEDSGAHHLGHAAACLYILLDAQASECLVDARPGRGVSAALLKHLTEGKKK